MQKRQHEKYAQIIIKHESLIERLCMRRAHGDGFECAELKQGCFIAIWKHLPSLKPDVGIFQETAWVAWQCRSVFSHAASSSRELEFVPLDENLSFADTDGADDACDLLDEMAMCLSPDMGRALGLMASGLSVQEMAHELGLKPRSVVQMRYRIIRILRSRYAKTDAEKNNTFHNNK